VNENKKENLFAKLAAQNSRAVRDDGATGDATPANPPPPSPAPAAPTRTKAGGGKKPEQVKGKRVHPDYCQANAYLPRALRREVDKALIDLDGQTYSGLVEDLLRKWLKSRGIHD
jgi:hypothetical protein